MDRDFTAQELAEIDADLDAREDDGDEDIDALIAEREEALDAEGYDVY